MADRPECDVEVLDLFVIDDDTGQLRTAEPWERAVPSPLPPPVTEPVDAGSPGDEPPAAAPQPQLSPMQMGPGPGQKPAVRPRPIGTHEIFHPVLVAPTFAQQLLMDGGPFEGIDALEVRTDRLRIRGATMTWPARLDTGRLGGRHVAELCVRPSPSWVLTIVELRPKRTSRLRSKRFLRAGIDVVEEMCDAMLAAAST